MIRLLQMKGHTDRIVSRVGSKEVIQFMVLDELDSVGSRQRDLFEVTRCV